jgi:hypothetical protein
METTNANNTSGFDVGAVLVAPTKDPNWVARCGVIGLLALVPIAGGLNLLGWMRAITLRRIRGGADADTLPPASLDYVGAGWRVFVARVPLGALAVLLLAVGFGVGFGLYAVGGTVATLGALVMAASYLGMFGAGLLASALAPAIDFLHIVDDEAWASVAFGRQWETIRAGGKNYVLVVVANLVGSVIAQLGIAACFVGLFVSVPYSLAVQAAALAEYARVLAARPLPGVPPVDVGGVGGGDGRPFGVAGG